MNYFSNATANQGGGKLLQIKFFLWSVWSIQNKGFPQRDPLPPSWIYTITYNNSPQLDVKTMAAREILEEQANVFSSPTSPPNNLDKSPKSLHSLSDDQASKNLISSEGALYVIMT